jgi:valyl-tRNA synthetase
VTRDLDRSFLARLREAVEKATAALDDLEYASALDTIERFFWSGFTDTYVEMVKTRARSETDAEGRASAIASLRIALRAFLRLFAPFVPYVTEEVWSWTFAGEGAPSVHRAPWPGAEDYARVPAVDGGGAVFGAAVALLEAVHKAKSANGASVGRHVARLHAVGHPRAVALVGRALDDVLAAARVAEHRLEARDGLEEGAFEVTAIEFAPNPEG